jgi:hypothetical protein
VDSNHRPPDPQFRGLALFLLYLFSGRFLVLSEIINEIRHLPQNMAVIPSDLALGASP